MTAIKRRLISICGVRRLPFATAASIVLLAGLSALASTSVRRCQILGFYSPAGRLQGLAAGRARILLFFSEIPFGAEYGWTARHASLTPDEYEACVVAPLYDSGKKWQFLGVGLAHALIAPVPGENWHYSIVAIPYWLILLPLLLLPSRAVRNQYARRCRARAGRCLGCGYDLRQSPDRCPECGSPKSNAATHRVTRTSRVFGGIARAGITLVPELLITAALAFALHRGAAVDGAALARAEAMTKLDRRLARFTIPPGTGVADAFEMLRRAYGVSLDVDWPSLTVSSYPSGSKEPRLIGPVELRLHDVTAGDALDAILDQADMFDARAVGFVPGRGRRVLVTLPSQFPLLCRIYDVQDVIASIDAFDVLDGTTHNASPSGGGAAELEATLDRDLRPADWANNGGTRVHHQVGRWLIVCHDEYGQRDVAEFLARFSRSGAGWSQAAAEDSADVNAAVAALNAPVGPLNLENATLGEALDRLSERTGGNLVPCWGGLWRDGKVRLRLDQASLGQALSILCASVGSGRSVVNLHPSHCIRGNRIEVFGATAPDPERTLRVYDLRPLIEEVLAIRRATPAGARGPAGSLAWTESQSPPSQLLDHLRTCLVEGVAGETWVDGGGTGRADFVGGRLIVLQTPDVQAKVAEFLRKLRRGGSPEGESLSPN